MQVHASARRAAVDSSGAALLAWTANDQIFAASLSRDGELGAPQRIGDGGLDLQVALSDSGEALVAWLRDRGTDSSLRVAARGADGRFVTPQRLGPAGDVSLSIDRSGRGLLVFGQREGAGFRLVTATRVPRGTFGPVSRLTDGAFFESVAVNPDGAGVVVTKNAAGLQAFHRRPDGSFEPPVTLDVPGEPDVVGSALAAVDGQGEALVVWTRSPATGPARLLAGTVSPGTPPTMPMELARGRVEPFSLDMDGRGDAVLAYSEGEDNRVVYRPVGAAGFSAPRPLAPSGPTRALSASQSPSIVLNGTGRALIGFERFDGARFLETIQPFYAQGLGQPAVIAKRPAFVREGPASECRPRRSRTVVASSTARAFSLKEQGGTSLYGCLLARGVEVFLAGDPDQVPFPPPAIALAGPLVAYAEDACDPEDCSTVVRVTDLRDEERGLNRSIAADPLRRTDELVARLGSVRVKANGAVAWISCDRGFDYGELCKKGGRATRVWKLGAAAEKPKLVASGAGIDPRSLQLRGSRLNWRQSGRQRTAFLK